MSITEINAVLIGSLPPICEQNPNNELPPFRELPHPAESLLISAHEGDFDTVTTPLADSDAIDNPPQNSHAALTFAAADVMQFTHRRSFLHEAIRLEQPQLLELLILEGCDVNSKSNNGASPFCWVAAHLNESKPKKTSVQIRGAKRSAEAADFTRPSIP